MKNGPKAVLYDEANNALLGSKTSAGSVPVVVASDQGTVPVSAASLPLPTGAATSANQTTAGSQTTKINDGTNTAAVKAASTAALATDPALVVAISPNSSIIEVGNKTNNTAIPGANNVGVLPSVATTAVPTYTDGYQVALSTLLTGALRTDNTSWLGSTAPTVGSKTSANSVPVVIASDQGTLSENLAQVAGSTVTTVATGTQKVGISDSAGNAFLSAANALNSTGTGLQASQIVAQFDDVSPTAITENSFGNLRISANRNLYGTLRDAAGNERGANVTATNALVVDGSAVTQPVSQTTAANLNATVVGTKTNNNAAPGATNIGALVALANAAAPTWTEGNLVTASVNLAGSLRTDISSWIGSTAPTVGSKTSANSIPVVVASDQGAITVAQATAANFNATVVGGKTNNNAAPGATNIGALTVIANAAAPTWTEGNLVALSSLLSGSLRTDNTSWLGSTAPTVGSKTSANSIPVVIASDQGAITVAQATAANFNATIIGNKTNNNAAPGATNIGALTVLANAANPTWTEGDLVTASANLSGAMRVTQNAAGTLANWWAVRVTDGTNAMPTADTAARAIFSHVTDGTNSATVKAASTAAVAADTALVVTLSPNNHVSGTYQPLYGTNNQTVTITLASLTSGSARASTAIDNTTNLYEDVYFFVKTTSAAAATSATGYVDILGYATVDNGTTYPEAITGTDAAITLSAPPNLVLLAQITVNANAKTYTAGPFSFCRMYGLDRLPARWGLVFVNHSGATLNATAGNHAITYQGINGQVT